MFTKQSCQHCGTQIEFDAELIGKDGYTILCPKCQAPVTLLRPPPIAAPPPITTRKRRRLWILGVGATAFALLILLMVSVLNRPPVSVLNLPPDYAITPEPDSSQETLPSDPLDRYAFDLGVKELNKHFYKSGDFVFAHLFRSPDINSYVQGKRVVYRFVSYNLSEANVMNGWEFMGEARFFIVGAMRRYYPNKDTGWSEWTMPTKEYGTYPATLTLRINKKKGGDWELTQPPANFSPMKPLSRDEVEELLKLPEKPSGSR
jgi:hypothetical protein